MASFELQAFDAYYSFENMSESSTLALHGLQYLSELTPISMPHDFFANLLTPSFFEFH